MKKEELFPIENSLKNFILMELDDRRAGVNPSRLIKYRGLSVDIDDADKNNLAFKVRIGAFEATFRISDGLKINGSLCGDEKLITKWYYRGNNRNLLEQVATSRILSGSTETLKDIKIRPKEDEEKEDESINSKQGFEIL